MSQPSAMSPTPSLPPNLQDETAKRYYTWSQDSTIRLVEILFENPHYQHVLPGRTALSHSSSNPRRNSPIYNKVFKKLFPGQIVNTERIKIKIRSLVRKYKTEKARLSLTGAGQLLRDLHSTDPTYTSRLLLSKELPWFEKFHEMMMDRVEAMPATLATSAGYNDEDMGMEEDGTRYTTLPLPSHISLLPMLPTLLDSVDESQSDPMTQGIVASEPGENAESPTQTRSSVGPSLMPSSPTSSPRANMNKRRKSSEAKRDALADSYYCTTVEKYNYKLQLSQERTRQEEMRLAVRREEKEREEHLHREDKEREERLRKDEKDRVKRLHKNTQDALLEVVRFVTSGSTSGGRLLSRSTVPNSEMERPPSNVEPQSFSDSLP